jgi:hypothetical protein
VCGGGKKNQVLTIENLSRAKKGMRESTDEKITREELHTCNETSCKTECVDMFHTNIEEERNKLSSTLLLSI